MFYAHNGIAGIHFFKTEIYIKICRQLINFKQNLHRGKENEGTKPGIAVTRSYLFRNFFLVRMFRNVQYMASTTAGINESRTSKCKPCEIEYKERNTLNSEDCVAI